MRVLVFGASTVQGFWDSQGGWADRLKRHYDEIQLKDLSKDIPHVMNLGISADGSSELLKRIGYECEARQNQKGLTVVISIGSNSAAIVNGQPVASVEQFKTEMAQIISVAMQYTDKVMLVGLPSVDESKTTPLAWADWHFKNDRIAEFESKVEELAGEHGIPFVPIHSTMFAKGNSLNAADGLHPNDAGHELIFNLVQPKLDKLLNT